jgi:hypothetical protein
MRTRLVFHPDGEDGRRLETTAAEQPAAMAAVFRDLGVPPPSPGEAVRIPLAPIRLEHAAGHLSVGPAEPRSGAAFFELSDR